MSCGFDVAAGIAGFVQLGIALTAACIKGFAILSEASRFSQDASQVGCMIELEQHRLISWADEVGLLNSEPELNVSVKDCKIVCDALRQLDLLLTDLGKLRLEYNLTLQEGEEVLKATLVPNTVVSKLAIQTKRKLYQDATSTSQRNKPGPWKKLKWIHGDAERVEKLLGKARGFIFNLENILEKTRRDRLEQALDLLIRKVVFNTHEPRELNAMIKSRGFSSKRGEAAAATARFKRKYLEVGNSVEESTNQLSSVHARQNSFDSASSVSRSRAPELEMGYIKHLEQLDSSPYRSTGFYQGHVVVVEWKYLDNAASSILQYRVQQVATLLRRQTDPSFHSLHCRGYLPDLDWSRYGYVFDFPSASETSEVSQTASEDASPSASLSTLRSVLARKLAEPSLTVRVEFAAALLQTVRQLHTADVVHKSICSENVLLFSSSAGEGAESSRNIKLFLGGYVYSRLASPLERTEVPESQTDADLYRHPLSIGDKRPSFRMSFDLYSLGCVLLELGLWRPLCDIFHELGKDELPAGAVSQGLSVGASKNTCVQRGKERILGPKTSQNTRQELEAKTGEKYSDLVFKCLHANANGTDKEQYRDGPLLIQDSCLSLLEWICV